MANAKEKETDASPDEGEGKKSKPKEEVVSKAKFDELLERFNHSQATLEAINGTVGKLDKQSQQRAAPGAADLRTYAKAIADEMGWDNDATYSNVVLIDRVISTVGQTQVFPILNGLADRIDGIEARQQFTDYPKFASDIDSEREKHATNGRYLSRTEAYHLVRGRRLPEIVEEERRKLEAEHTTTEPTTDGLAGGTSSKVGPTATSGSLPNPDDLARMSKEDRLALLERLGNF